jgi:hypothetical protein
MFYQYFEAERAARIIDYLETRGIDYDAYGLDEDEIEIGLSEQNWKTVQKVSP